MKNLLWISILLTFNWIGNGTLAANIDAVSIGSATGNFDLNITKDDAVSITGMRTVTIAGKNGGSDKTGSINVCTYATTPNYQIEINSLGIGGAAAVATSRFDAGDGTGKLMNYSVKWNDFTNDWDFSDNLDPAQVGASPNTIDNTCGGGTNTTITVSVRNSDFNKTKAAVYIDTLEVIITAQ